MQLLNTLTLIKFTKYNFVSRFSLDKTLVEFDITDFLVGKVNFSHLVQLLLKQLVYTESASRTCTESLPGGTNTFISRMLSSTKAFNSLAYGRSLPRTFRSQATSSKAVTIMASAPAARNSFRTAFTLTRQLSPEI